MGTSLPLELLGLIPLAYLVGSIPFGLLVGLARGIDPRKSGSGNIGATNLGRLLGGRYFALVFTLDVLKGMAPVLAAGILLARRDGGLHRGSHADSLELILWLSVGLAAILGHVFSLFLSFKGGKGVATSLGVALGIFPYFTFAALGGALIFAIVFKITRYVSLASMVAAGSFPLLYISIGLTRGWPVFREQLPLLLVALLVTGMIFLKHRANIARLRAGTENRFGRGDELNTRP